jgi:hypothetical protein
VISGTYDLQVPRADLGFSDVNKHHNENWKYFNITMNSLNRWYHHPTPFYNFSQYAIRCDASHKSQLRIDLIMIIRAIRS